MRPNCVLLSLVLCAAVAALAAPGCASAAPTAPSQPGTPAFLIAPHVSSVDSHSARLVWASVPGVEAGTVVIGKDRFRAEVRPLDDRADRLHEVALRELQPGAEYAYTVECGGSSYRGSFKTAPTDAPEFRFVIYGDTRSLPERHRAISEAIAKEQPDFVVHTGDLVANGDVWALWNKEFFEPAEPFLRHCAFWPCRGNHEGSATLYRDLFDAPNEGTFYSFDWGNVHIDVLDNYQQGEDRRRMLDWFKKDLAENKAEWTLVVDHEPTFNVGGHGSTWGRDDFLPVMYEHGVDFALAGHSHLYERFLPIAPAGKKPIIFVVTGGGGAPVYAAVPSPILAGGIGDAEVHYCVFDVHGDHLTMTAKRPDGSVIDRLELTKKDGAYQPSVMAQTVDYDTAVAVEFVFAGVKVDLPQAPAPGQTLQAVLRLKDLPAGSVLTVGPATDKGEWTVPEQRAEPIDGGYGFKVTCPRAAVTGDVSGFRPPLRVQLSFQGAGLSSLAANVTLSPGEETLKGLHREPTPVAVHKAPRPITLDGDLSDWDGVAPLPNPFHHEPTGPFRFCWTGQGLYGAVEATDADVKGSAEAPWSADGVEVFVDKAFERSLSTNARTAQYAFSPATDAGPGPAHFVIASGANRGKRTAIACAWRPTATGYTLEFFLPAAVLAPAHMQAGTVMGLNETLDDDGKPVRQFYSDKAGDGYRTPILWGAIRLEP
jgi:predicted phosphodiesterase